MTKLIAVIDDDPDFLALMKAVLDSFGMRSIALDVATDASRAARAARPDLIILDLRMEHPDSGWSVLDAISSDAVLQHTPVILCSADALVLEDRADELRGRGYEILLKPFHLDDLERLLRRMLGSLQ